MGEAWDTMLSGFISWVSKQAQLNTNALSLWEGWWLIAQASLNDALKLEDLDVLTHICLHNHCLASTIRMSLHRKRGSRVLMNAWMCQGVLTGCCTMNEPVHHNVAGTMVSSHKTLGLLQPKHLHQTMDLREMEVQCQLPPQCHQGLVDLGLQASAPWPMPLGVQTPHENQSGYFQG